MNMNCTNAMPDDLDSLMYIERCGFTAEEAAAETAMRERIQVIPDTFLVARNDTGRIIGFIVGPAVHERHITDDLFTRTIPNDADAQYQTVLSLAVHPRYRTCGVAKYLLEKLKETATFRGRKAITLTCLEPLVGFYEKYGYINEGISQSAHAGEIWYNMVLEL